MNNKLSFVAIMMAVLCMMTSCLNDDTSSSTQYDDVAVTSFTLGTLNKIVYTKRNGKDSTYTTTASCSSVLFTVDNVNNKIYNVDSLTRGIVTSKALVTISTKNSGYAYLKSLTGDTLTYISSTDSLDFSQPRTVRIYANDGSWYKDYNVDVRTHKEPKDSVYWSQKKDYTAFASLRNIHAVCFRENMIVYGTDASGAFKGYTSSINDGNNWTTMTAPFTVQTSLITDSTTLYAYTDGKIYASSDNATWTQTGTNSDIRALAIATKGTVYAVATDGRVIVSTDNGATWNDDAMDDDKSLMPSLDIQGAVKTTSTNSDIVTLNIFGNTGNAADSVGVVWTKMVDTTNSKYTQPWQYSYITPGTYHKMPALVNMSIIPYADGFIMIGGAGRGTSTQTAFSHFWLSENYGLAWKSDKRFYFPTDFECDPNNFAFIVDSSKYMWIICGESGQVWRGRLTQMTWTAK